MNKACIIGASGYTGAELIKLINRHPELELTSCFVSENSAYAQKTIAQVHPQLHNEKNHPQNGKMRELSTQALSGLAHEFSHIFLATPHEFSHDHLPSLLAGNAQVFDLSGAYRLSNTGIFEAFYGFEHKHPETLKQAAYGLAEWQAGAIKKAKFIAVPGCYPTASLLALKPLTEAGLLQQNCVPVINATSGVSGAGRKASAVNSFQEVSLQAYGVLQHRHMPEIEEYAGLPVIFTPHLGAFKRGILATITAFVKDGVNLQDIQNAYSHAYQTAPLVRLMSNMPRLDDVVHTPFCDIGFAFNAQKQCVVVSSAIDNLLKGASSQAIQCCNLKLGVNIETGLL